MITLNHWTLDKNVAVQKNAAGCRTAYIDGSFVSNKLEPEDFDMCWDRDDVDINYLSKKAPLILNFYIWNDGPKKKPNEFQGRASSTQDNQGQWFRVEYWVEAEKVTPKYPGRYIINFKRPIGRVYHPDGTTTEEVSRAVVVRNADGTLKSAYPVTDSTVLK